MHDGKRSSLVRATLTLRSLASVAMLGTLAIVACSSAPNEDVASGKAALVSSNPGPPVIEPNPLDLCTIRTEASPPDSGCTGVAEYVLDTSTGDCPDVTGPTGFWSTRWWLVANWDVLPLSCAQLGLSTNCCRYSWNPAVAGAGPDQTPDPSLLCSESHALTALPWCPVHCVGGDPDSCGHPSGGGCPTCRLN